jgi:uncharacterized alkaline shock family protein YloU
MSDTSAASSTTVATPALRGGAPDRKGGTQLQTEQGNTTIADSVVSKIAGVATREVPGVHDMGKGTARTFGAIKEKLPVGSNQPNPSRGVKVEVGERQAAVDLDIVVEYGASITDVAQSVRRNVIDRVEGMTGLEVVEVNIAVDDVWLGDDSDSDSDSGSGSEPRVE